MERDFKLNHLFNEFPLLKDRTALDLIKCKNGKTGFYVCYKHNCKSYPFMCTQKACICKKQHQNCDKSLLQDFLEKLQNKSNNCQDINQWYDKMIDLFVEKLINQANRLKAIYKQKNEKTSFYTKLSQKQKEVLTNLQKNQVSKMEGNDFYIIHSALQQKDLKNFNDPKIQIQKQQKYWKQLQQNLLDQLQKIEKRLNLSNQDIKNQYQYRMKQNEILFIDSKIAQSTTQNNVLKGFFNSIIKNAKLLYRASENNFEIKKFKQKCCNISNTLTLIQTEFSKKVGGFTEMKWINTTTNEEIYTQDNKSAFIFSLTNNQKFQPNINSRIYNYITNGPSFGGKSFYDICIRGKANQQKNNVFCFNSGFTHKNYPQAKKETYQRFNGTSQSLVKLKDWQVWQLQFQN